MKIERAKENDLNGIIGLNRKFFNEIRNFREIIENNDNFFLVGKENGKLIGFSGMKHQKWNNTAQIIDIFIHPSYRGKGYGNKFIKKIKERAKEKKIRTIIAEAPSKNTVLHVYQKNGFRICGFNDRYYSNDGKEIALFLSFDIK